MITSVSSTEINGIVPPVEKPKTAELKIVFNLITYQNTSIFFTYANIAVVNSCFPPLGPARGGTLVVMEG